MTTRRLIDVVLDAIERGETPIVVWPAVIVPEPAAHGEQTFFVGNGRRHGFVATYKTGCRCLECTEAHRRAAARHRATAALKRSLAYGGC